MKLYYTTEEGGKWKVVNRTRKQINDELQYWTNLAMKCSTAICAMRVNKSPIVYDFVLLKRKQQPWIRNLPNVN